MAETRAVYYRDQEGVEPVDEFIESLPAKRAAKIDDYVEEYVNGRPTDAPPPDFPITSQIEGELRELRIRFANTRYRVLYQRSDNLVVFYTPSRRTPASWRQPTSDLRKGGCATSRLGWTPVVASPHEPRVKMRRLGAEEVIDGFI